MTDSCAFRPFPGNGAYGHWTCELPLRHRGQHRYGNYRVARVPHFWDLRGLRIVARSARRQRRLAGPSSAGTLLRKVLYPTTYDPVS